MIDMDLPELRIGVVEDVNLPCEACKGQCCTKGAYFTKDEVALVKRKYKGKFKKLKVVPNDYGSFIITQKGVVIDEEDACVFYNNGCEIYEDRPTICQDYGSKLYAQCGFNGLTEIPDHETQVNLVTMAQKASTKHMLKVTGLENNIQLQQKIGVTFEN